MSFVSKEVLETILVVDDEPAVLKVVVMMLERAGYGVLAAATAAEALQRAESYKCEIRLIVLNHCLDAQPGRNLVDDILVLHPHLKVLRFSGFLEGELRSQGEIAPDSFFIQKPFRKSELIDKVQQIIGLPETRKISAAAF